MQIYPLNPRPSSQWFHTDSLELFQENIQALPASWAARSWQIHYEFNSTGHRMREWTEITWPTYMAVVGDSTAMGLGLALTDTWSHQLSQALSLDLVNVSEPQTTIEDQTQSVINLFRSAPSLPRLLVLSWTDPRARSYLYQGQRLRLCDQEPSTEGQHYWWINHQRSLAETSDLQQRFRDQQKIIECLCQRANVALWQFTSSEHYKGWADDLTQPRLRHPDLDKDLSTQLEFLARDVELVKTTKEQRRKGWGDRRPRAHPGLYHQQRVLDAYWAAGIELRY